MGKFEEKTEEERIKSLRSFNIFMGFLHLIQGALMVFLSNDTTTTIRSYFIDYDDVTETFTTNIENVVDVPLGIAVALFLFMSAIAHFSVSTFGYEWYARNLKKGINYARWIEYSFSASLMIVVIALLVGIYDFGTLIALFGLIAGMNYMGLMMELHNQNTERTNWTSFWLGCILGIIPWIVIYAYFFGAIWESLDDIPTFVIGIVLSIAVVFNIFPINMALQYKKVGRWKDYLYGERFYIFLSLFAKSLLAWQVWSGTLRG
jgi:hypothetical protein